MIYLSEFYFPSQNSEANYLAKSPRAKMTCYDSFYPFGLFAGRGLKALDLADVTILYGGNGSGKTTALVARLGYMIYVKGVGPEHIHTETYTNAATRDMKARFEKYIGGE